MEKSAAPALPRPSSSDAARALIQALKVGGSLLITWGIALAVRFTLPRELGPEGFGAYNFAEALAMTFFVFASFGVETYIHKEIPLRPAHASEFLGPMLVLRAIVSTLLVGAMALLLQVSGRTPELILAAVVFGVGQLFFMNNNTFVALLNARGTVDGMSVANVAGKLVWAFATLAALGAGWPLWTLAAAFAVAEAVRSVALLSLCRRHLELSLRGRFELLWPTLRRCAPFFLTALTVTLYAKLDVTLIEFLAGRREVGFYGAAALVSNLGLMLIPLISAVLMPLFTRARSRSEEELFEVVRRSLEAVLALSLPVSLALFVGADLWILAVSGENYGPAALALQTIAPAFLLNYVATLCASCLNLLGRAWLVTWICVLGVIVSTTVNVVTIPLAVAWIGEGGGGAAAALATVVTEGIVCALMLATLGRRIIDGRLLSTVSRMALACAVVIGADLLLQRTSMELGPRVGAGAVLFLLLAVAFGCVRPAELRGLVRAVKAR